MIKVKDQNICIVYLVKNILQLESFINEFVIFLIQFLINSHVKLYTNKKEKIFLKWEDL